MADIDRHIPDRAAQATHQLALHVGCHLAVQAADGAARRRVALIVLHKIGHQPGGGEAGAVEGFTEIAARIGKQRRCDQQHIGDGERFNLHNARPYPCKPSAKSLNTRPSSVLPRLWACYRNWVASMKPMRNATSSGQPTSMPWRDWMVCTKVAACNNESGVPASSHAQPRPSRSTCSAPSCR